VFDFARDVGRLWACFEDCAVRDVQLTPDGVGSSARRFSHLLGIHMERVIEYTEVVPSRRIVGKSSAGPIFTITFEPADGSTTLTVNGEWHLAVPVVGAPVEDLIMKRSVKDVEAMLASIKAQVEETGRRKLEPPRPSLGEVDVRRSRSQKASRAATLGTPPRAVDRAI